MRKLKCLLSGFVRQFTMIEILIVMVLLMVLAGLLMPAINESRKKAKFVRWYGHNNTLSRDPSCAGNFNFQDVGQLFDDNDGPTPFAQVNPYDSDNVYCVQDTGSNTSGVNNPFIANTAAGCEAERFILKNYHGYLRKDLNNFALSINPPDPSHFKDCFEKSPGGRWGLYKKALKFDGSKAFIDIPADQAIDFTPEDSFTINMWVKLNRRETGMGLFSKCKWGFIVGEDHPRYDELCSSAQYDFYVTNPSAHGGHTGVYDADVFEYCYTATDLHVPISETYKWHMVTLRYDASGDTSRGYVDPDTGDEITESCPGATTLFINGKVANQEFLPPNNSSGIYDADNWAQSTNGQQHLVLGAIGLKPDRDIGELAYFFDGEMDEFNLFRRALSNAEIKGIHEMGAE